MRKNYMCSTFTSHRRSFSLYSPMTAFATLCHWYDRLMDSACNTIITLTCCGCQCLSRIVHIFMPNVAFLSPERITHVHIDGTSCPRTKSTTPPVKHNHNDEEAVGPTNAAHIRAPPFQRTPPVDVFGRECRDVEDLRDCVVVSGAFGPPCKEVRAAFGRETLR
jgi:hypothetical protein